MYEMNEDNVYVDVPEREDPTLAKEYEYPFMRCRRCARLCTRQEIDAGLQVGRICPCGSVQYFPTDPLWYEFLLPRVIKFGGFLKCVQHAYLTLRGKPWPGGVEPEDEYERGD